MINDLLSDIPSFPGLIQPGNIDLENLPRVQNDDGTFSTVRSMLVEMDGKYVLLPTIINSVAMSPKDAIASYKTTGNHLGVFGSEDAANAYDKQMHEVMGWGGSVNNWPQPITANSYDFGGMIRK